jgi:Icc protein
MARPERDDITTRPAVAPSGRTLACFDRPRGKSTTLMVVADAHLSQTAYGTLKCFHRTKQRLEMAFADAHRLNVDGVVVAGDLTRDGTAEEYALADELLSIAPRPTVVVPGNHDVSTDGPVEGGREFASWLDGPAYPTTRTVAGLEVTGLDTTRPAAADPIGGSVSADALESLSTLSSATPRIAVMHHPLAAVPGHFASSLPTDAYRVQNPDQVAETLLSAGTDLVIGAHVHWPYVDSYRGLNVVGTPSTASFPPSYLLVHVDRRGTTVELVPLAGEVGLSEAYEFALEDDYRGEAIRQAVADGYFEDLPFVDEREPSAPAPESTSTGARLTPGAESR